MAIETKKLNGKQRAWVKKYESETGFDVLYQDQLDSGEIDFYKMAQMNISWWEDHSGDVMRRISDNVPGIFPS